MTNKKAKKYGRTHLNIQDTIDDLLDLDPFERAILKEAKEKNEHRNKTESTK